MRKWLILLLLSLALVGCGTYTPTKVTILEVITDRNAGCTPLTVFQSEEGYRFRKCGEWGTVGETFTMAHVTHWSMGSHFEFY